MTALMEMQGRRLAEGEAKSVIKESESRLRALSLVHNNLFKSNDGTMINLKSYLEEVLATLQTIFEIPGKTIEISTNIVNENVDAEDAIRIGLIVNELVTNSVKHAFAQVEKPIINLDISKNAKDRLLLQYIDNGPGVSEVLFERK